MRPALDEGETAAPARACRRWWRRFAEDRSANVAIMFGLLALPLIGLSGLAIDYFTALTAKARLDQAADAAALAALRIASDEIQSGIPTNTAFADAKAKAVKLFTANAGILFSVAVPTPTITISLTSGNKLLSQSGYATTGVQNFGKLFGAPTSYISGQASATLSLPTYINVYLMVDTSGSMSIGASSDMQTKLISTTGCAFACHDGQPVNGYPDAYAYAEAKGYTLRYDVINQGILKFLDTIDTTDPSHQYIRASLYSFDSSLNRRASLTSNTGTLRQSLPAAPATSGDYDGATHFNESISSVMSDIGSGGSGTSASDPKKLLIIATDGVQDPTRTWTSNIPLRAQVKLFDMSFCGTLTARNVTVAFIHMPYLPMPWDWGYVATLGQPANNGTAQTRVDVIQPALQACAGNFYTLADNEVSLSNAFNRIFQNYVGIRLIN